MPARQLIAIAILFVLGPSTPVFAWASGPGSGCSDEVERLIARHERVGAKIATRRAAATKQRESLRARRANHEATLAAPRPERPSPNDVASRTRAIAQLRALWPKLVAADRARLALAIDAEHHLRDAKNEVTALLRSRDRNANAALVAYEKRLTDDHRVARDTVELRRGQLDALLAERDTEAARLDQRARALRRAKVAKEADAQRTRVMLSNERNRLAERETDLVGTQRSLAGTAKATRAAIRAWLTPPKSSGPNEPMRDLRENAVSQAALRQVIDRRRVLIDIVESQRLTEGAVADLHDDRADYLARVRRAGIKVPPSRLTDPKAAREDAAAARQRAKAYETEANRLRRENKTTKDSIAILQKELAPITDRYERAKVQNDFSKLAERAAIDRETRLPLDASPAACKAAVAVTEARAKRKTARRALIELGRKWATNIDDALAQATALAAAPAGDADYRRRLEALDRARTEADVRARESHALVARYKEAGTRLEQRLAALSLALKPKRPQPTRWWDRLVAEWKPRLVAAADRLPTTPVLIGIAALLLVLGLTLGRASRPRALAMLVRLVAFAGTVSLVGIGALRGGAPGVALAGAGSLASFLLLGRLPLNALAGIGMRFNGDAEPGTIISNGDVEGRVLRRGLTKTRIAVQNGTTIEQRSLGNASLRVVERKLPTTRPSPQRPAPPPAGVTVRVTIDSDWMAVRELVERIAAREVDRPRVGFHVEAEAIRLVIRGAPANRVEELRRTVETTIDRAPFARRLAP